MEGLNDSGLAPFNIAFISPFSAKAQLLPERLRRFGIEIGNVIYFQGRKKEAVIVSLKRLNRNGEVGFLQDVRRMNLALIRARRKLMGIGGGATIAVHPFYHRMIACFESIGAYHSVWKDQAQ